MRQFTASLSAVAALSFLAFVPPLAGLAQSEQAPPAQQVARTLVDFARFSEDHRLFADAIEADRTARLCTPRQVDVASSHAPGG